MANVLQFIMKMQDQAAQVLRQHGQQAQQTGDQVKQLADTLGGVIESAKQATEAIAGIWASNKLANASLSTFASYEEAMLSVEQTTHLTGQSLEQFRSGLTALGQDIGRVPTHDLEHLAETAGRLGVKGAEGVLGFTKEMAKLSVAAKLGGDDVTTIGRTLALFGEANPEGVTKFANALTTMATSTKASAGELVAMTSALGRNLSTFKLGTDTMLGIAATTKTLDMDVESTASNLGQAMRALRDGAINGGAGMQQLVDTVGMSRQEFAKLMDEHPEEALEKFLEVLKSLNDSGQSPTAFLEKFALQSTEQQKILGTLSGKLKLYREEIEKARRATTQGTALDEAATKWSQTTQAAMSSWHNATENFYRVMGEKLAPAFNLVVNAATAAVNAVSNFLDKIGSGPAGQVAAWFITLAPAVVGLAAAFGTLVKVAAGIGGTLMTAFGAIRAIGTAILPIISGMFPGIMSGIMAGIATLSQALLASTGWGLLVIGVGALLYDIMQSEGDDFFDKTKNYFNDKIADLKANIRWSDIFDIQLTGDGLIGKLSGGYKGSVFGNSVNNKIFSQPALDPNNLTSDQIRQGLRIGTKLSSKNGTKAYAELGFDYKKLASQTDEVFSKIEDAIKRHKAIKVPVEPDFLTSYGLKNVAQADIAKLGSLVPSFAAGAQYGELAQSLKDLEANLANQNNLTEEQKAKQQALVEQARALLKLKKEQLDPLWQINRAQEDAARTAAANTKEAQNQLEIQQQLRDFQERNGTLTAEQAAKITAAIQQAQDVTKGVALGNQNVELDQQLAAAKALTQAEKDRLDIARELYEYQKQNGELSAQQAEELARKLQAIKTADAFTSLRSQLDPIGTAATKYTDDVRTLTMALQQGLITQQQFNQMAARLKFNADEANPIKSMVKDMQQQLDLSKMTSREGQIQQEVWQKVQQLQQQGVTVTKEMQDAITDYARAMDNVRNAGDNGFRQWADGIKDFKEELADLERNGVQSFADSLVDAIGGGKNAWQSFLSNMGKQLLSSGVNSLLKSTLTSTGLTSWGGGKEAAQVSAQQALNKIASLNTITAPMATVNATSVSINGAALAGTAAAGAASGASGVSLSAANNAQVQLSGKMSQQVQDAIRQASDKHGVSLVDMAAMAKIESSFNPDANRYNSRAAKGLYQFIGSTGKQYGLNASNLYDPYANADAGARLYKDDFNALRGKLGYDPTGAQLYLAHQQGMGGATALINNPQMNAIAALQQAGIKTGASHILQNGGTADMTSQQFMDMWAKKFEQAKTVAVQNLDQVNQARAQSGQKEVAAVQSNGQQIAAATEQGKQGLDKLGQAAEMTGQKAQQASPKVEQVGPAMQQTASAATQAQPSLQGVGSTFQGMLGPLMSVIPGLGQFSGAIQSLLSGLFSGGGGGGILSAIGLHGGGQVGVTRPAFHRNVSPLLFAGAPRFHTGLKNDEFAAILQKNERVITEDQNSKAMRQLKGVSDTAGRSSGAAVSSPTMNVGGINVSVTAPQGNSGNPGQDQEGHKNLGKQVAVAIDQAMTDWVNNQRRPGGVFAR